jgi:hypothetical protein
MLLLVLIVPTPVMGQNRLTNGHFDADVSGWGSLDPVTFVWDIHDADMDPASGSLKLTTHPPGQNQNFHGALSECVNVFPSEDLLAEGWVIIGSEQFASSVEATISVQYYASPSCQPLDFVASQRGPTTTVLDQWTLLTFQSGVSFGAQTAQVYVQARTTSGGIQDSATVQFDAIYLPEPAASAALAAGASLLAGLARRSRRLL